MNHCEFHVVGPAIHRDGGQVNVPVDCRDLEKRRRVISGLTEGGRARSLRAHNDKSVALLNPYFLQLRVPSRDVETTGGGDEFQV